MPVYVLVYRHAATIRVSVKNYGEMMSLEEQSACFNRYYRAGRNANEKSSGLELAIAKEIFEKERDSIWVQSAVGGELMLAVELSLMTLDAGWI